MLHFYHERPYAVDEVHMMLGPARALEKLDIPFVVFSDLFDLTILVPDQQVQAATKHIQKEFPQYLITQERYWEMMSKDGVCALPRAMRLLWKPKAPGALPNGPVGILIVPQSHFHFDVADLWRSCRLSLPCDPSDSQIRFPTMPAFLDALIDSIWEPVDDIDYYWFIDGYLNVLISYLALYNVRDEDAFTCPSTKELLPAAKALLVGLKPENVAFMETYLRTGVLKKTPELRAIRWQRPLTLFRVALPYLRATPSSGNCQFCHQAKLSFMLAVPKCDNTGIPHSTGLPSSPNIERDSQVI